MSQKAIIGLLLICVLIAVISLMYIKDGTAEEVVAEMNLNYKNSSEGNAHCPLSLYINEYINGYKIKGKETLRIICDVSCFYT